MFWASCGSSAACCAYKEGGVVLPNCHLLANNVLGEQCPAGWVLAASSRQQGVEPQAKSMEDRRYRSDVESERERLRRREFEAKMQLELEKGDLLFAEGALEQEQLRCLEEQRRLDEEQARSERTLERQLVAARLEGRRLPASPSKPAKDPSLPSSPMAQGGSLPSSPMPSSPMSRGSPVAQGSPLEARPDTGGSGGHHAGDRGGGGSGGELLTPSPSHKDLKDGEEIRRRLADVQSALFDHAEAKRQEESRRRQEGSMDLQTACLQERLRAFLSSRGCESANERRIMKPPRGGGLLRAQGFSGMVAAPDFAYPLHLAAKAGDYEAVEALLWGGADRELRDSRGLTPLALARKAGSGVAHKRVVALLSGLTS